MALKKEKQKHGMSNTRIYNIWSKIKYRCLNPNDGKFQHYGGKGVNISSEWKNDFLLFFNWAIKNGYKDDLTIDRINPNGNYEPSNCRWISLEDNARRANAIFLTVNGVKLSLNEWSKKLRISPNSLSHKYKEWGKEKLEQSISKIMQSGDNSILYKRKGYSQSQIN